MLILGLDSALDACAVALWRDGETLAARVEPMRRGQAEALIPMAEALCAETGTPPGALDAVAVTVGPGAFTGLRIGIAAARGLALALDIPAVGVTTTAAIAAAQPDQPDMPLIVVLETKRADLYAALYDDPTYAAEPTPETLSPGALVDRVRARVGAGPVRLAGDGTARAGAALSAAGIDWRPAGGPGTPPPETICALGAAALARGEIGPPRPLYLRPPDVTLPPGAAAPP